MGMCSRLRDARTPQLSNFIKTYSTFSFCQFIKCCREIKTNVKLAWKLGKKLWGRGGCSTGGIFLTKKFVRRACRQQSLDNDLRLVNQNIVRSFHVTNLILFISFAFPVKKPRKQVADNQPIPEAKLLDDLFRRTKAAPSIYWLPLSEEQVCVLFRVINDLELTAHVNG